ncbi:MAG: hypothetical protein ACLFPL_02335 [Candidatus Nanoarchaeia archaeon]
MGFLKTLLTGKRDELSEEERERFEAAHGNLGEYQPDNGGSSQLEEESISKEDEVSQSSEYLHSSHISLNDVLTYIRNNCSENELVKIKNTIAYVEDRQIDSDISSLEEDDFEVSTSVQDSSETVEEQSQNNKHQEEEDYIEIEGYSQSDKKEEKSNSFDDDNDNTFEEDNSKITSENLEDDDTVVSVNNNDNSTNSDIDPPLFSVIHDELMELFEDGTVVLLKEEFTFPSIGNRETLAFGIYNSSLSNIKDQTHWFVQKLKQFSRLKECKMLLSEEYEKDLILEINEKHAILLCFKTSNLIQDEFIFNRKWN